MSRGYERGRGGGRGQGQGDGRGAYGARGAHNAYDAYDERRRRDPRDGRGRGIPDSLLVALLAFLLGLTVLVWTATGLAGLFAHGAWPDHVTFPDTPMALRSLISAPHNLAAAWPDTPKGQLSGYGLFWGILVGELMVLLVLTIFTLGTVTRYRAVRAARRERTREAGGEAREAGAREAAPEAGREAAAKGVGAGPAPAPAPASDAPATAPASPSLHKAPVETAPAVPEQPTPLPTASPPLSGQLSLPRVQFGPDRTTTRGAALAAATAAEGPLIVATTDPALWSETKDARAKLGPLLTYDPTHRLDTPARLRWSPTSGCEDIATATTRAAALLAPVRPTSALDSAVADAAQTLLRCWLHAAAVDGRPFRQLHRWAHSAGAPQEPVRILRTDAKASPGQAGELESVLTAHAERREIAKELVGRALKALSSIHIRDACTPLRADSLILESFIDEGGTLYVVGEPIEDPRTNPGAMPLLTALLSSVVEHGRRMAERSSDGRLDPPLTLVLDDIAALAPVPALPTLLETGATQGLLTLATLRSQEQARARWPHSALPV